MTTIDTVRTTLATFADDLKFGKGDEVTLGYLLRVVLVAIEQGKLTELEARVDPLADKWINSVQATASGLAMTLLQRSREEGNDIHIPSLGITIPGAKQDLRALASDGNVAADMSGAE